MSLFSKLSEVQSSIKKYEDRLKMNIADLTKIKVKLRKRKSKVYGVRGRHCSAKEIQTSKRLLAKTNTLNPAEVERRISLFHQILSRLKIFRAKLSGDIAEASTNLLRLYEKQSLMTKKYYEATEAAIVGDRQLEGNPEGIFETTIVSNVFNLIFKYFWFNAWKIHSEIGSSLKILYYRILRKQIGDSQMKALNHNKILRP